VGRGWALVARGEEVGIPSLYQGVTALTTSGASLGRTSLAGAEAEAYFFPLFS